MSQCEHHENPGQVQSHVHGTSYPSAVVQMGMMQKDLLFPVSGKQSV